MLVGEGAAGPSKTLDTRAVWKTTLCDARTPLLAFGRTLCVMSHDTYATVLLLRRTITRHPLGGARCELNTPTNRHDHAGYRHGPGTMDTRDESTRVPGRSDHPTRHADGAASLPDRNERGDQLSSTTRTRARPTQSHISMQPSKALNGCSAPPNGVTATMRPPFALL